jgi:phosphoglycerate dehydrogenase-like enzyme
MASDMHSVAILDDYQGVALSSADWTPVKGRVVIDVFRDTILDEDGLVRRLEKYEIICAMRERTKFPRSLLDRLPKLRYVCSHSLHDRQCNTLLNHTID